ncbi:hypothetical protein [Shinella zoogloeoides]|uniref:hypothetical protein n=1 Tax=Shinella zoogloeoides TaxID=352475 RepID=UPI00273F9D6C|nr:hypothetical protein [Shinella zoogloeoides]WLR90893.1 hypothetical protein Q9316_00520 [Shinella zoogloeoides]
MSKKKETEPPQLSLFKDNLIIRHSDVSYIVETDDLGYFEPGEHHQILEANDKAFFQVTHTLNPRQLHRLHNMTILTPVQNAKKNARIYKPPGHALTMALRFVLPKKIFERVVEQMILDAREEYNEALAEGSLNQARWIAVRLYLMVGLALAMKAATLPLEKFSQFMQKD